MSYLDHIRHRHNALRRHRIALRERIKQLESTALTDIAAVDARQQLASPSHVDRHRSRIR
jgi:hypothetical protein